jgi:hypothetical protein
MRKPGKSTVVLLVLLAAVASIAWFVYDTLITPQCDFDGYLIDPKIQEELSVALRDFERQHNVAFDDGLMAITSCTDAGMVVPLGYETPLSFSKYGISYDLSLSATYSLESREVTLQMFDRISTTDDVLTYIDSLKDAVAEFESTLQMDEFATQFKQEGARIRGTVHEEFLWVEAFPQLERLMEGYTLSAQITYSTTRHSISSYSLPNRIPWRAFPEIPVIHEIVNEKLLVNELSNCAISTQEKAYATTDVGFTLGPAIRADVKLVCSDTTAQEKNVRIFLQPDGTYEAELLIQQPDGSYESQIVK